MSASTPRIMLPRKLKPNISVTPGFFLLLGLLLYLDDRSGIIVWAGIAALIHETGHFAACVFLGGRAEGISLSLVGAEMKLSYPKTLSYGEENYVLLAGALLNLLTGLPALYLRLYWLAWISFGLGIYNLLPVIPLDGGHILFNLIAEWRGPNRADTAVTLVSAVVTGILVGLGGIGAVKYANLLPLGLSIWLLVGILVNNANFPPEK